MKKQTNTLAVFCAAAMLLGASLMLTESMPASPQTGGLRGGTDSKLGAPAAFDASALLPVGLYDSDSGSITNGDLNSQDYWWTKFDAMMLEIALKAHQPEGHIGLNLTIALRRIDDLLKKYPKHEQILKWKAHFEDVQSKINPDTPRGASFGPECPWDEANFAQLWVNFHWIKLLIDEKDWNMAHALMSNVQQNYQVMLAPDRMKNYPDDLRKWVVESKPEADKMAALIKSKTGG